MPIPEQVTHQQKGNITTYEWVCCCARCFCAIVAVGAVEALGITPGKERRARRVGLSSDASMPPRKLRPSPTKAAARLAGGVYMGGVAVPASVEITGT